VLSNYNKYINYREIICNQCNSFVHPNVKNQVRRIKNKIEQLLNRSDSIKINGFAKYPIPIELSQRDKDPQLYELCAYEEIGFY
jgi:hypothetical protein